MTSEALAAWVATGVVVLGGAITALIMLGKILRVVEDNTEAVKELRQAFTTHESRISVLEGRLEE